MNQRLSDHLDDAEDNEYRAGRFSQDAYRAIIANADPEVIRAKCDLAVVAFKQVLTDRKWTAILQA